MKHKKMPVAELTWQIQQLDYENEKLREEIEALKANTCDAQKFYCAKIGVESVATLHNVHADTVRKYANLGMIPKHPDSTDGKMLFRASDILLLDFRQLLKDARYLAYNR